MFAELVDESEALETRMAGFQDEPPPQADEIAQVRRDYRAWHIHARRLLAADAVKQFGEQRDGGIFSFGIGQYLDDPRQLSVFQTDDRTYPLGQWQYPFEDVRGRLEKQRTLLFEAAPEVSPAESVAADLAPVLRRLPELLTSLRKRRPEWPIGESIRDEHDLQVMVEALLRILFEDVRREDDVPSKAGANSRVDFVLPEAGVVVETKMTRANLTASRLGEELLVDAGRYPGHPNCSAIVAYIYDPDGRIENPRGLERDLTVRTQAGLSCICVVS
jgi:hypothetical protein